MRKILLIILVFYSYTLLGQIRSGEITYKVKLTDDAKKGSESIKDLSDDAKSYLDKYFEKQDRILPYLEYTLIFNQTESLFENHLSMDIDSGVDLEKGYAHTQIHGRYYTNLEEKINLRQFYEVGKKLLLQSELDSLDWKIQKDEKIIQGYVCKKATANIHFHTQKKFKIIAWFTPDLPFSFGPADVAGLPGLILGLERQERFLFYADKINLSKKERNIERPTSGRFLDWPKRIEMMEQTRSQLKSQYE